MTSAVSKWVEFNKLGNSDSGKTQLWQVVSSGGTLLGMIKWFSRWRKYAFYPFDFTVYEQDCLREIANFCEGESKKHSQSRRTQV